MPKTTVLAIEEGSGTSVILPGTVMVLVKVWTNLAQHLINS
ncbi:MAG: hypothetical protein V7K48_21040 [Nostoc sp.]